MNEGYVNNKNGVKCIKKREQKGNETKGSKRGDWEGEDYSVTACCREE